MTEAVPVLEVGVSAWRVGGGCGSCGAGSGVDPTRDCGRRAGCPGGFVLQVSASEAWSCVQLSNSDGHRGRHL